MIKIYGKDLEAKKIVTKEEAHFGSTLTDSLPRTRPVVMAEDYELDLDSIISRLLEGKSCLVHAEINFYDGDSPLVCLPLSSRKQSYKDSSAVGERGERPLRQVARNISQPAHLA